MLRTCYPESICLDGFVRAVLFMQNTSNFRFVYNMENFPH